LREHNALKLLKQGRVCTECTATFRGGPNGLDKFLR
jgi:hypothetical protein